MMEKLAQAGGGGGMHAHPLSLCSPSRTKLQCTLQLRGQHSPYFISTPIYCMCSVEHTYTDFFQTVICSRFSLYIINLAGLKLFRDSGEARGAQRYVYSVNYPTNA